MIVLGVVVVVVLGFHVWQSRQWSTERQMLVKAVMARHPGEFVAMTAPRRPKPPVDVDDEIAVGS